MQTNAKTNKNFPFSSTSRFRENSFDLGKEQDVQPAGFRSIHGNWSMMSWHRFQGFTSISAPWVNQHIQELRVRAGTWKHVGGSSLISIIPAELGVCCAPWLFAEVTATMEIPDLQKGKLHGKLHLQMLHVPLLMFFYQNIFFISTLPPLSVLEHWQKSMWWHQFAWECLGIVVMRLGSWTSTDDKWDQHFKRVARWRPCIFCKILTMYDQGIWIYSLQNKLLH